MKTLKYAWRFLVRSKSYTVINIVGLSLSLACTIILVRYIHQETRVNTHCIDAENVYIYRFGILMGMYMQVVYQMDIVEQIQFSILRKL